MSMNDPQRPRSTPIPGGDDIFSAPAPTAGEFLGTPGSAPGQGGFQQSPFGQPGQAPGFQASPYQAAPYMQFGQTPPGAGIPTQAFVPKRRRSGCGLFITLIVILTTLGGIGAAVWGIWVAKEAVDDANDLSNPELSDGDREALGLPDDVETLFQEGAAAALIDEYEAAIGSPLRITEAAIYTDYAFLEAQDPSIPTNLDRYGWRSGEVEEPDPESNRDDLDTALFAADEVNWDVIPVLAAGAASALGIPDGEVSHIIVTRDDFGDGEPVIRVYITSPRDSGYLEARASTGEVLAGY